MSAALSRFRVLAIAAVLSAGTLLGACSSYSGDSGADRSEQQSQDLRNRITTTQIDR